jgi:uncharacterized protein
VMSALTKPHGYVFDVPMAAPASGQPLLAIGQRRHEAAAVDHQSGMVYFTEDNDPASGFYRFIPTRRGDLSAGVLQMLKVVGRSELRRELQVGAKFKTTWVTIERPELGHTPGTTDQSGNVMQGAALGAALFLRLEGIYIRQGEIFFTSTSGGDIGSGQVFCLREAQNELELIYESTDKLVMDYPDQISAGVGGGHVICQDSKTISPQSLWWLSDSGKVLRFAEHHTNVNGVDYTTAEWAGCSMSPDGKWLFANVYSPGYSVAITGDWTSWLKGAHAT